MIGIRFHERMRGSWHTLSAPADERPIEFDGEARIPRLRELLKNTVATFEGTVVARGLTDGAHFEGTIGLGALARERRLPYAFSFRGDDGRAYRFDGAKEVAVPDLVRSMTTLPGYVFDDDGTEVGRAVLHFDLRGDLLRFVRSWRPVLSVPPWFKAGGR